MNNPLQKYFRQPKLFISLPSKGLFYKPDSIDGDYSNVPIFAMTGMDEIIMKTPDALFSGEATVKLIESCCPYIKDAKKVPSLDIDAILVAIRIATFGQTMTVSSSCKNCGTENDFEIDLSNVLDHYSDKVYENQLTLDDLVITMRPLDYEEMSKFNIENFKLQKMLSQLNQEGLTEEEKQKHLDNIYNKLAEIQLEVFLTSIESVQTPDATVTEKEFIKEWLANSNKEVYQQVKDRLEKNKESWSMPKHAVKCVECGTEDLIEVALDQSSFFE
jgi:hypothetical protein